MWARAVGLEQLLCVAVVGRDEGHSPEPLDCLDDAAEAGVGRLDRPHDRRDHPGVADHVRVGEVDYSEGVAARLELDAEALGDFGRGHLRFLVVRADLARARHEQARLGRPLVLAAAVEEVSHVRVLLRLRRVQLAQAVFGEHLGERLVDLLLAEDHRAGKVVAVVRHRGQVEAAVDEQLRELARPVGPEVEEDRRVVRPEPGPSLEHDRLDELVGDAEVVARLHGADRVGRVGALAQHDRIEGALRPLPAGVPVHRPVAAGDRRDPFGRQLGEVVHRRGRRDVAPVGERVDPGSLRRKPQQRLDVIDVRMHAAVRDEAEQVHVAALGERGPQDWVLEERAVRDRAVYTLQVLVEHPAGADRQVADLGVAHLTGRQADRLPARLQPGVRVLAPEAIEDRRLGELDRVARSGRRAAPAVEHDEDYEIEAAARQSAVNDSTSSEAPPTSAPSTPSCESSSSAFSAFTEPPYSTGTSSRLLISPCACRACPADAVWPVPIAQTGSYAITSRSCGPTASFSASTWMRSTSSVCPDSRSSSDSPTQAITRSPPSRPATVRLATVSSVSPKYCRRSEWPTIAPFTPSSVSMAAETSPV